MWNPHECLWLPQLLKEQRDRLGVEKQDEVVMGKEPEQQIKDEQWEFIRDEVEKMKEAREIASNGATRANYKIS